MPIDKELYLQARQWYQERNRAEAIAQAQNTGTLTPGQKWELYADLWEFCARLSPLLNDHLHRKHLANLGRYHARVQRFEAWRKTHGGTR